VELEVRQSFLTNKQDLKRLTFFVICALLLCGSTIFGYEAVATDPIKAASTLQSVSVIKNQIVDQDGKPLRLLGVNKSGTEYACFQGWGIFDGDFDSKTVKAMKSWGINTVRIPLNSACWLERAQKNNRFTGSYYKSAIIESVKLLSSQGMIAILDLHWNPTRDGKMIASTQSAPNLDAVVFWRSVAIELRNQKNVIFDLFNEPQGIDWKCWRNGCILRNGTKSTGMQNLIEAIRRTGSKSPIIFEGNQTATDFSGWGTYRLIDPLNQLIASNHNYQGMTGSNTFDSWNAKYLPISKELPLVTGELGQPDCKHDYVDKYMDWADANGISYLGWTWNVTSKSWPCVEKHSLISDSSGTPSGHGLGFRDHILKAFPTNG